MRSRSIYWLLVVAVADCGSDYIRDTALQNGNLAANAFVSQVRLGNGAKEKRAILPKSTRAGA